MEEKQLFSSTNDYDINQICEILNQNEIPFVKKEDGSGSYMNISMGKSFQEKRIFVNDDDYEKAMELIEPFTSNNENNSDIEDEEISNKSKKVIRGVGFLILAIPIVIVIVLLIMSVSSH